MAKKTKSNKPFYKKVWFWVLAAILVIGGCNDTDEPSEDPNGTTAPSTSYIAETTAPTAVPETTVPETTVFENTAPETTAPETTDPKSSTPKATTPKPTDPKPTDPEPTTEPTVPATTTPAPTDAETVAPETNVPETTTPKATSAPSGNRGNSSSDANQNSSQSGADSSQHTYIANKSTEKFHYPYCSSVKTMNEENKWEFTGTREELINMDYKPCGICNP